ncbi:MAG TPA: hypothetical protein PKJ41_15455 [Bryobacteraceae bacterium]|nr:hypothetical protein [Bryobacteraceae bacterium]HPT28042.1 hypothetical protein [Bryobacteraceae bacterium]
MAGRTLITFAQDGLDPITFEVSAHMMDKIYQKIERTNQSAVLGTQITGAADWWLRETSDKIIQPLLAEFPDPDPAGVAERMVRIQTIQAEIEEMKRHAFVLPVSMVAPEGGV